MNCESLFKSLILIMWVYNTDSEWIHCHTQTLNDVTLIVSLHARRWNLFRPVPLKWCFNVWLMASARLLGFHNCNSEKKIFLHEGCVSVTKPLHPILMHTQIFVVVNICHAKSMLRWSYRANELYIHTLVLSAGLRHLVQLCLSNNCHL